MRESSESGARTFTIVSAVHNVARYLDDFFASLTAQSFPLGEIEVVLVDDGSTDDSRARCEAFAVAWPGPAQVLHKENGGQGSARNLGLAHASGHWVTFTDPDDTLDPDYFAEVAACLALAEFEDAALLSTAIIMHQESSGLREDRHPLNRKFRNGNQVYDLAVDSDAIQLSAATAFFRRDLLAASEVRFDDRIRPTFEDCAFIARYLLSARRPTLGVVATARYYYRKRADASSTIETSGSDPAKYTVVPRLGHLALLEHAARSGPVPVWLQNMVVYDLAWYLMADTAVQSKTGTLSTEVADEFHGLVGEILRRIDETTIALFSVMPISDDIRFALLYGFGERSVPIAVRFDDVDVAQRLVRLSYRFTGSAPTEQLYVDGRRAPAAHAKYRSIEFYQRVIGRERILWAPAGGRVRLTLNGERMPIQRASAPPYDQIEADGPLRWDLPAPDRRPAALQNPEQGVLSRVARRVGHSLSKPALFETAMSLALHSAIVRRRYAGSWVFMDRDVDAGDSAEQLYRYVAREQRHIRPYFVLRRDSPDWPRLRRDRVRLIPYGSWRWQLLMLCAGHVASSHADLYVIRPLAPRRFGLPQWRFTFLQHGVIKDDLSRWLNAKRIDLFVTSSAAEYDSIVSDDTPYVFTTKEVALTGLPRFDALLAKRTATSTEQRRLLLVTPTWRYGLVGDARTTATDRTRKAGFAESAYQREWSALLSSGRLRDLAEQHGLEIVFMPHPNMTPYLDEFDVPSTVRIARHGVDDIQHLLARTRLLVTDYSSVAFNAAVVGAPTVYFQFDRESFYSGAHPGRSGYFDYERDGFGPVATDVVAVERAVDDLLNTPDSALYYAERAERAIAYHDTENSKRVFEAMTRLDRVWRPESPSPE